jgi:hypothetical protein
MKKKSIVILGLLAALLAFSMVLTGCPDSNGGGGGGGGGGEPAWPASFVYTTYQGDPAGGWAVGGGEASIGFATSPDQENRSYLIVLSDGSFYRLMGVSGTVFTVQKEEESALTGSSWTFTAAASGSGGSAQIVVSASGNTTALANGTYTRGTLPAGDE